MNGNNYDYKHIRLEFYKKEDAKDVLDNLRESLEESRCGYVSCHKLFWLADLPGTIEMFKWGWRDLKDCYIYRFDNHYTLSMPPAEIINSRYDDGCTRMMYRKDDSSGEICKDICEKFGIVKEKNEMNTYNNSALRDLIYACNKVGGYDHADRMNDTMCFDIPMDELANFVNFVREKERITEDPHSILGYIPPVRNVEFYNEKVTKVNFVDGTYTKAICGENDIFNEDTGITICLFKRLLGGQKEGTKTLALLLTLAHNANKAYEIRKEAKIVEKEEQKKKRRKAELKRAAKKLKAKEDQIGIQKTAITQAFRELGLTKEDDLK